MTPLHFSVDKHGSFLQFVPQRVIVAFKYSHLCNISPSIKLFYIYLIKNSLKELSPYAKLYSRTQPESSCPSVQIQYCHLHTLLSVSDSKLSYTYTPTSERQVSIVCKRTVFGVGLNNAKLPALLLN